jgi:hypothetical protein
VGPPGSSAFLLLSAAGSVALRPIFSDGLPFRTFFFTTVPPASSELRASEINKPAADISFGPSSVLRKKSHTKKMLPLARLEDKQNSDAIYVYLNFFSDPNAICLPYKV